ncbi:MAG: hypothetical protein GF308_09030 [Candidatus Heimdallarchaeota archaeon]|nr:hypothetical protein [Candidatus Heimdallarchaeota archaeon]
METSTELSETEVRQKIEEYLNKRGVDYQKDVPCGNNKKMDYLFKNGEGEAIGLYILLWKRPITYRAIFNLIDWTSKEEFSKIILVCRIMGERAREIARKEPEKVSYILESSFRKGDYHPLLSAF